MLCSVLGANPPMEVIKGYMHRIWQNFEIDKIVLVRKGIFLVRFKKLEDKIVVESKGLYFFDRKPFVVQGWNEELKIQTDTIMKIPLWIQFPELELKYWGLESLSKIGSLLGHPLKSDKFTLEKTMLRYARLLVEFPMEGPFPDSIDFFNEEGIMVRQKIIYEWKPCRCSHCGMLGHKEEECRKKTTRWEWRPVTNTQQQHIQMQETNTNQETAVEFTPVTRHYTRRAICQSDQSIPSTQNGFQQLKDIGDGSPMAGASTTPNG